MTIYAPTLTLREARARYFAANGFGEDGGYSKRWVTGWIGPVPFAFPNAEPRVRAVRFHDLHHLVTGYDTDFAGESQISAWEIASGCKRHLAAWLINLSALCLGLFFDAGALFRAFVLGRHSRNFYDREFDDALLDETVGDARARLLPSGERELVATHGDRAAFVFWMAVSATLVLLQAALLLAPLALLVAWLL